MSIAAAAAVLDVRDPALTVAERYVLLIYAVRAREDSDPNAPLEAWPTAARLAEETGLTREHVQRCRGVLIERNLIRQTGRRKGRSDVYQVNLRLIRLLCADITATCDVTSQRGVMSHHTERKGKEQGKEHPHKSPTEPAGFADFWQAYPRHVAKGAALRAYARALKATDEPTILGGAKRYADDPNRLDAYTKHPATWLNQECWSDDPLPGRVKSMARDAQGEHWAEGGDF